VAKSRNMLYISQVWTILRSYVCPIPSNGLYTRNTTRSFKDTCSWCNSGHV